MKGGNVMVKQLWMVEIEISIKSKSSGVAAGKFVKTVERPAPHEKVGDMVIIPVDISNDKNTTKSIQGEVVNVCDKCPLSKFARLVLVSNLDDITLRIDDLKDRLIAKGWRKVH